MGHLRDRDGRGKQKGLGIPLGVQWRLVIQDFGLRVGVEASEQSLGSKYTNTTNNAESDGNKNDKLNGNWGEPSAQVIPTLGPNISEYYLHWAIWILLEALTLLTPLWADEQEVITSPYV